MLREITVDMLDELAELFMDVFNDEPWNDKWDLSLAKERLKDMMDMPRFMGMAEYQEEKPVALIMGRGEQWFDGVNFQVIEFCVAKQFQGQGIGSRLLSEFMDHLKTHNIRCCYLYTMHGERTEGFYEKNGFAVDESMCQMYRIIPGKHEGAK